MTFFFLLRETGYNWDLSKKIFYNLTDTQLTWLNKMLSRIERRISSYSGDQVKSFDLRPEGYFYGRSR